MHTIGILGGTFNPVHVGHLEMAQAALVQGSLEHILWVPMQSPPHKKNDTLADFHHRVAMVQQAIAPYTQYSVSLIEANRLTSSYAIQSWRDLQSAYPSVCQWVWILGLDAFQTLPRWYGRDQLVPHCQWLVAPRSPMVASPSVTTHATLVDLEESCRAIAHQLALQGISVRWQGLEMSSVRVSSSQIRQRCRDRQPLDGLVPESVQNYLQTYALYAWDGANQQPR
jgi:nicotinate-nucleotide adenylyltransferase